MKILQIPEVQILSFDNEDIVRTSESEIETAEREG